MATDIVDGSSALLVIDMQAGLVAGAYREAETLANLRTLIARPCGGYPGALHPARRRRGASALPGNPQWEIHPALAPEDGDPVIRKRAPDAFYATRLDGTLRSRGISRLVITGIMTEYRVDTTSRRAASLGYDVTLVADGHTTGDSALLTAAQIVAHHNAVLGNVTPPDHPILVIPTDQVTFAAKAEDGTAAAR